MCKFELIQTQDLNYPVMVLLKTSDSLFDFIGDISDALNKNSIAGLVLFDELLHSGNNEERFISASFENGKFIDETYKYVKVDKRDSLRRYMCSYLQNNIVLLDNSGLIHEQQKLIKKGIVI